MSSVKLSSKNGFAPIWIVLLIFLLGGIFLLARNNSNFFKNLSKNQAVNTSKESSAPAPSVKKLSLREICLEKIKDLPPPPHRYENTNTLGTLLPLYDGRKRFPDEDKASACETKYDFFKVREQVFTDMGLTYYKFSKSINANLPNYPDLLVNFPKKVDSAYEQAMKLKGWERKTAYGEKYGGLPYTVFYKEDGIYKMYTDVTLGGDDFMTTILSVIKN